MSSSERSKAAAYCTASESQKAAALFPDAVVVKPVPGDSPASRSKRATQAAAMKKGGDGGSNVKRLVTILAMSVLLVGGITAYTMLSPNKNAVALSDISSDLPISEATRKGAELNVKLTGDAWFTSDKAARELALKNTLRSVAAIQIDTVMVYDSTGNFRASAHWFGSPPVIAVRLKR